MVLSTTKRTSSISSIVNRNQGGGMKKAGIPSTTNISHTSFLAYGILTGNGSPKINGMMNLMNMRTSRAKQNAMSNMPIGIDSRIKIR